MVESLEWKTNIISAEDGSEQRVAVRSFPRQSFDIECIFKSEYDQANSHLAIAAGQNQVWGFPCFHEMQRLSVQVTAGAESITIDTTTSDYRDSDYAVLWVSQTSFEVLEVDTVSDSSLSLSSATIATFPAGALIMPLRRAYISHSATINDYPVQLGKVSLTVSVIDGVDLSGGASDVQYQSQDVISDYLLMPSETRQRTINRNMWTFDPEVGPLSILATGDYPAITTEYKWRTTSPANAWAFRQWLHRRSGRLVPVWFPTRTRDLSLAAVIGSADTTIIINDMNLLDYWEDHPGKQNLALVRTDGSLVCRNITDVSAGEAGQEVITIDSAVGVSDIAFVSFLSLNRFAADRIELAWERAGVAEIKASMIEVAA